MNGNDGFSEKQTNDIVDEWVIFRFLWNRVRGCFVKILPLGPPSKQSADDGKNDNFGVQLEIIGSKENEVVVENPLRN